MRVAYKCFPGNAHARLLQRHPEEFKSLMFQYLEEVQNVLDVYDEIDRDDEERRVGGGG